MNRSLQRGLVLALFSTAVVPLAEAASDDLLQLCSNSAPCGCSQTSGVTAPLSPGKVTTVKMGQAASLPTIYAVNTSPTRRATSVVVTAFLPPGITFSASGSTAGCSPFSTLVTCRVGDIDPGGYRAVTIAVSANATGSRTIAAGVVSNELDNVMCNNSKTVPLAAERPEGPIVTGVAPNAGPVAGGTPVTISGTGFLAGARVTLGGASATVGNVTGTSISATTPGHAAGPVDLTVSVIDPATGNTLSSTLFGGYTYQEPPQPPPVSITQISPVFGPPAGGTTVTILGSGFAAGAAVTFGGAAATGITVQSANALTAVTPARGSCGPVTVAVSVNGQTASVASGFLYTAAGVSVSVSAVSPTQGGVNQLVVISGSGFEPGATVFFGGVATASVDFHDSTSISTGTPAHAAGPVDVVVTNPGLCGQSATLAGGYTYQGIPAGGGTVVPSIGPTAGNSQVWITAPTGVTFSTPLGVVFGDTLAVTYVFYNSTQLYIPFTPPHAAGTVNVIVQTPTSSTIVGTYTYVPNATVTAVTPGSGPVAGGTPVTLSGSGFLPGAALAFEGVPATNVTVVNSTTLTATTPAHAAGPVTLVLANPGFPSVFLSGAFTYQGPALTITSINPNSGGVNGGENATVAGTNFVQGAVVSIGPWSAKVTSTTPTTIGILTPAAGRFGGTFDVTVTNPDGFTATLPNAYTYTRGGL